MNKKLAGVFFSSVLLVLLALPTFAANSVSTINIDAVINSDGSVNIRQTWEGDFTEGTENYIPMNAPDYLTISDLAVTDNKGRYETLEDWNTKGSLKNKAYKCGVNYVDGGYEICFGISEYGQNTYTIEYKLDNVVGGYTDMDGVNFRFVNDQMNTGPTDVAVAIRLADGRAITDEYADIWAFGFEGQVSFSEGAIVAYSDSPITADNHVTVMFGFNKGTITPTRTVNDSFETVKNAAFDGSDYDYDDGSGLSNFAVMMIVGTFIFITIGSVALATMLSKRKKQKDMAEIFDRFGYFRQVPNDGDLNTSYALARLFEMCTENAILATGMLRLIDLGCLIPISYENVGMMGKIKETLSLQLAGTNNSGVNEYDEYLYSILKGAAGADGILQEKELGRFADKNDELFRNYISRCDGTGKEKLVNKDCLTSFASPSRTKYLTPNGEKELGELLGFKKYLEDFSLIAERGVKEIPIWKEMLTYAMLFDIADKVSAQMKDMYPELAAQVTSYEQTLSTAYSYQYILYRNMQTAQARREQEQRSSGSGGFSSFGGGGGSIGGGSGGGSR